MTLWYRNTARKGQGWGKAALALAILLSVLLGCLLGICANRAFPVERAAVAAPTRGLNRLM